METNEERESQLHEDALLALGVLNLIALNYRLLIQDLHGIDATSLLVADEENLQLTSPRENS